MTGLCGIEILLQGSQCSYTEGMYRIKAERKALEEGMLTCAWHLCMAVQGGSGTLRLTDGAACTSKLSQVDGDDASMLLSSFSIHHDAARCYYQTRMHTI